MKTVTTLLSLVLLGVCFAQQSAPAPSVKNQTSVAKPFNRQIPLDLIGEPKATDQWATGLFGPILCDEHGGIYMRPIGGPGTGSAFEAPIIRLGADGSSRRIDTSSIPDLPAERYMFDFTIDKAGRVYQLVQTKENGLDSSYVATLSKDGEFLGKVRLDRVFQPTVFVVLPSGDFLISGVESKGAPRDGLRYKFSGVFASNGELKRWIEPPKKDDSKGSSFNLSLGDAAVDDDGSIYLLRSGTQPAVTVLSSSGEPTRTFTIAAPFPNAQASELFASGSRLLVVYESTDRPDPKIPPKDRKSNMAYTLYDTEGNMIVSYVPPYGPGVIACFGGGNEVTLLKPRQDMRFGILQARLP